MPGQHWWTARGLRVTQQDATRLLRRASEGEIAAAADLLPLVYDQLHSLAEAYFRNERLSHTLQPTALVHEAYLRLVDQTAIEWKSRNQFFVVAAKAMRNILVDHARTRNRAKRGGARGAHGAWQEITIQAVEQTLADRDSLTAGMDMIRVDEVLAKLARFDERKAALVELRFFAGLTSEDAADVLGISRTTASEEWRMARAWLHRELKDLRS
ncbi:MAG: ECF-type sigma factor [Phycisphaerales bacterium]|nr:ECF-type sigma factor [Phycisphaerales bacterium]MCI0631152.1 ECF-type sigma factor [Phycisphaerales bacterium]